jgi:hypothetical protein
MSRSFVGHSELSATSIDTVDGGHPGRIAIWPVDPPLAIPSETSSAVERGLDLR